MERPIRYDLCPLDSTHRLQVPSSTLQRKGAPHDGCCFRTAHETYCAIVLSVTALLLSLIEWGEIGSLDLITHSIALSHHFTRTGDICCLLVHRTTD
jgi:hypothetical protein